jgi:hypothetical protein
MCKERDVVHVRAQDTSVGSSGGNARTVSIARPPIPEVYVSINPPMHAIAEPCASRELDNLIIEVPSAEISFSDEASGPAADSDSTPPAAKAKPAPPAAPARPAAPAPPAQAEAESSPSASDDDRSSN